MADRVAMEQQANDLIDVGKLDDAASIYKQLIGSGCEKPEVFTNLAAIYGVQKRFDDVITLLRTALNVNPNDPNGHYSLGNALQAKGDLKNAILSYQTVLKLTPNDPDTYYLLGTAFQEQGNTQSAINSYRKAIELNPDDSDAHNSLGICLRRIGESAEALNSFKTSLKLNPNFPEAHCNFGTSCRQMGHLKAAINSYQMAIELKPNYSEAQTNLALLELLNQEYKNGWERYEYRRSEPHARPGIPRWDCSHKFKTIKEILLVSEQGLGDTLHFMRYVIALRNQGIAVSLCAQPKLHALIQASGIDPSPINPQQANEHRHGHWAPLLSIPGYLEVTSKNPIITEPYIKTTEELRKKWSDILRTEKRPIIGINWQGNPETEKIELRGRSLPLEEFEPIASGTNMTLLSLQKGHGSEQLNTCTFRDQFVTCQNLVNETWDFLETSAIIANCDLVITSDTSIAHLAGGMGQKTWLLLTQFPEWRWGLEGEATFWYPSMRLFRQKQRGNWSEVMQRATKAIREEFSKQDLNQTRQETEIKFTDQT